MTAPTQAAPDVEVTGQTDTGELQVRFPVVVLEGVSTSDGRYLTPGGLSHRALPLSLLACPASAHGGSDPEAAVVIGRIDSLTRTPGPEVTSPRTGEPFPDGTFVWSGEGAIDATHPIADLVRRRFLRGVSVDLSGMDVEIVGDDGDDAHPERQLIAHSAEIAAVTLVPIPAFGDAYVELADDTAPMVPVPSEDLPEGLVASAAPAWRSAEVGDYPALVAAGEGHWPAAIPPEQAAAEELAGLIADDGGEQRDATELAAAIVQHIREQWATGDADTAVPEDEPAMANGDTAPMDEPDPPMGDEPTDLAPDDPQPCHFSGEPAVMSLLFDDDTAYLPVAADYEQQGRDLIAENGGTVSSVVDIRTDTAPDDDTVEVPA